MTPPNQQLPNDKAASKKPLSNKRILLGITGGIAAYKAAELLRCLKKHHANVRVVMTTAAQQFITPMTMQALSGNPVHTQLLDANAEAAMGHIELAKWADLIVIAPASADFLARLNTGMANDLLSTLCLASNADVLFAPAMNQAMWNDPQTQANMAELENKGMINLGSDHGPQACGDTGLGRMLEPDNIYDAISQQFQPESLAGKKLVITAGPTQEAIDPVRYISNHSSGKMGYALAEAAINAGALVTLISGPVNLSAPERSTLVPIISAQDMLEASLQHATYADIFIACAAVADYRPQSMATQKIKKTEDQLHITLVKNTDIVAAVTQLQAKPFTVGFAAETENLQQNALSKMQKKRLDLMVANDVSNPAIGFNSDNNAVTVISTEGETTITECSKNVLAQKLISIISQQYNTQQ